MKTFLIAIGLVATISMPLNAEDLSGTVTQADGEPLAGAVVAMYTAHPRFGTGVL